MISVSDVLLVPMLDTPNTDLKMAILHPMRCAKQPNSTIQKYRESHFEDPHPSSYATVMNTETMHAEELEVIPEQPTMSIEPTMHPSNQHRSSIALCAVQVLNEIPQLCSQTTSVESMPLPKIPIVNTSL